MKTPAVVIPPDGASRLRKIRRDAASLLRDTESYNDNALGDRPLDTELERVVINLCDQGIRASEISDGAAYLRVSERLVEITKDAR